MRWRIDLDFHLPSPKEIEEYKRTLEEALWSGISLPFVLSATTTLTASTFVSFAPLPFPSGMSFYLDYKYPSKKYKKKHWVKNKKVKRTVIKVVNEQRRKTKAKTFSSYVKRVHKV